LLYLLPRLILNLELVIYHDLSFWNSLQPCQCRLDLDICYWQKLGDLLVGLEVNLLELAHTFTRYRSIIVFSTSKDKKSSFTQVEVTVVTTLLPSKCVPMSSNVSFEKQIANLMGCKGQRFYSLYLFS
jgi:hypothetical protein